MNNSMQERLLNRLRASQSLIQELSETLVEVLVHAAQTIFDCFVHDHKLIMCSDEASYEDMRYFSSCCLASLDHDRPGLRVLCLECYASASLLSREVRLLKQLNAFADPGDMLIVFAFSEDVYDCIQVIQDAHILGMSVLTILGPHSIPVLDVLNEDDLVIPLDQTSPAYMREMRLIVIHALLDLIDGFLLG